MNIEYFTFYKRYIRFEDGIFNLLCHYVACNKSYGEDCQYPCSPLCINQTCDRFNGTCLTSCTDKSYGDKCIAGTLNIN